ncbi:MAG TPA: PhoU domain-containing protein [Pseudonocardiaceae bacterium]|nr:PhoU domain-containing protein [Pseudonocardiaceae bacterium]
MRAVFRTELAELMGDLARMARLAAQMLTAASIALHQADPVLADLVITDRDRLRRTLGDTERRAVSLLALQAPVAGDLRVVVAALRAVGHLPRMGELARHIALVAQLKCPNPMASSQARELDALRCHLFGVLFAQDWSHGVERAVGAALIGRYYERFGDHAVAIAQQVSYVATGQAPESAILEASSGSVPVSP